MTKYSLLFLAFLMGQNLIAQTTPFIADDVLLGKTTLSSNSLNYSLLPEVALAFQSMQQAAKKDSIELNIVSSFRSYAAQKRIWNRKYKRFTSEGYSGPEAIAKIIEYSTLPGTSRHHWGTDIDLIDGSKKVAGDVLLEEHFHRGEYQKLHQWMQKNALKFGFELVYTKDSLRKGFLYEPWHYSYAKISKKYLTRFKEQEVIKAIVKDSSLLGNAFISKAFLATYYQDHVLGINARLK